MRYIHYYCVYLHDVCNENITTPVHVPKTITYLRPTT